VYGYRTTVADNLHYGGEDGSLFFAAGHSVVVQAPDGRGQRFIPGTAEAEGITALALSPNKKLLAVAERADKGLISVYDTTSLKKRKVLMASDVGSQARDVSAHHGAEVACAPFSESSFDPG
jgi:cilia- and flagella-associated protein 57